MTTVIATRDSMYTDTLCGYTVPFKTRKYARIGTSVFAGSGDLDDIIKFFDWRRAGGDAPNFEDPLDVLEVCHEGIFIWGKKLTRLWINQAFYAVGSGSQYAMGAMFAGATPQQAIKISAQLDEGTSLPIEIVKLTEKLTKCQA